MQTSLAAELLATDVGSRADAVLRSCVHCGFCLATCPTYQLLGNELDSPRGRIYLIKEMLEGAPTTAITRTHLDRCLTCRSCETTCPSGVNYHQLLDIGRAEVERRVPRHPLASFLRWLLRSVMSRRQLFTPLLRLGQLVRPLVPTRLRNYVPIRRPALPVPAAEHQRRVLLVQGCVQPGLSPTTNEATRVVLDRLGISVVTAAGETCCGALDFHLNAQQSAAAQARRNVDAWWPLLETGVEAIVMNASGCSNFVRDYADLLRDDPQYADRAAGVVEKLRDISEILAAEDLSPLQLHATPAISWHCPCTAQHGQQLDRPTREVLTRLGFNLPSVTDAHLCCGSAGTYSLFHADLASELRSRKLDALLASEPEQVVTANIGCQMHLAGGTDTPVVHWIELVARQLGATISEPDSNASGDEYV
jgi:glycolate oxidase iron-sulfur subunit